eukprot:c5603_g1_i2.p1 GENE.c5603_g1_i2~~c5603_g1_i2.p1  ORF type:complete len:405 (-),score=77.63 c5603_g1_i2:590-1765(-)
MNENIHLSDPVASSSMTQNLLDQHLVISSTLENDHLQSSTEAVSPHRKQSMIAEEQAKEVVRTGVRKLVFATVFALLFMGAEFFAGYLANSLAVMTDAAHLLADVAGFGISLFSIYLAQKPATIQMTYGMARAEVLGALVSILTIWGITCVLVYEAVQRTRTLIQDDKKLAIDGKLMFIISCAGLVVNIILLSILGTHGHSHMGQQCTHGHSHSSSSSTRHDHSHATTRSQPQAHSDASTEASGHNHSHSCSGHGHTHSAHNIAIDQSQNQLAVAVLQGVDSDRLLAEASARTVLSIPPQPKREENLNVRAAYIHAIGDLIQNAGVMIAGALIWWQSNYEGHRLWQLADPICTFFFSILVLFTTLRIGMTSLLVLMEGMPKHVKFQQARLL